ncbi:CLUMA_CG021233, isoform A [Clunio marinus]|uniref:CLUMA_CG021233, isoform A n=1 Tax=Clunio marinus TaxID=568069 RepID=A0A1J1J9J4_9DIPT|nr:CLUMA_CG021233, isoform A [Clunio marinus]
MGKNCSKENAIPVTENIDAMEKMYTEADYKTRLEQKLYIFKETPEPICDLSECNLEKLPGNSLFSMIKVLRKEILILSKNRLKSLASGGQFNELELLQVLDLNYNKFKVIPIEICVLKNLRELFLSNNLLTQLPSTINRLKKLELLDVSNNNITDLRCISFMPELKILNVSGNKQLKILPPELATCESLHDLVFDIEIIVSPSNDVLATGPQNILKFLSTGELSATNDLAAEDKMLMQSNKKTSSRIMDDKSISTTMKFMEKEKFIMAQDDFLEEKLHKEQQKKKEEMLKSLLDQQRQAESAVNQIQSQKDLERKKLIDDIMKYEESSTLVVNELLSLKKGPDAALLELEDKARDALLEKVHLEQNDLRKRDVISAMSQLLEQELSLIQNYQDERSLSSRVLLENETKTNLLLDDVIHEYDRNRTEIIEKVNQDEDWQKSAVAALIAKNDARSWGLMEQIKIVESQIAAMTNLEIDKKKINQDEIFNDVADKRINLTMVLLDLMEQQDQRKQQLRETLLDMENQKTEDDFWLLQYQKLIDSRGVMQSMHATIDPSLGYNFLINGVIHVVPFLLKIWQRKDFQLEKVSDEDLRNAGIKNPKDRQGILRAIHEFLAINPSFDETSSKKLTDDVPGPSKPPSAPQEEESTHKSPTQSASSITRENPADAVNAIECVICMDAQTRVIFLPCGHLCCCIDCSTSLVECPMCRASIERKIRVIQA